MTWGRRQMIVFLVVMAALLDWGTLVHRDQVVGTTTVPWADYSSGLQGRLDRARTAQDCDTLNHEYETADADNAAAISRTGHDNARLIRYIDEALNTAGCY